MKPETGAAAPPSPEAPQAQLAALRSQLLQLQALHTAGTLDAPSYEAARAALERRLGDLLIAATALPAVADATVPTPPVPRPGVRLWALVGAFSLAVAAGGYWWTGSPAAIAMATSAATAAAPASGAGATAAEQQQLTAMVDKLAARLADKPDDAEGWTMLGRSYLVLEKMPEAAAAYARALALRPQDAGLLADYADALAASNGRQLSGEPTRLLDRALALEPDNLKALMLAGTAAFIRADYVTAVRHWDRVAQTAPADHPWISDAAQGAAEARRRAGLPAAQAGSPAAPASAAAAPASASAAAAASAVAGTVALAPALRALAAPDDTVFIYARPAEGGRMPLAVLRKQVKDLPLAFRLDDSLAMSPQFSLSTATRVVVSARVSKSGQATPQKGDLEGLAGPLPVGSSDVRLVISAVLP